MKYELVKVIPTTFLYDDRLGDAKNAESARAEVEELVREHGPGEYATIKDIGHGDAKIVDRFKVKAKAEIVETTTAARDRG